MLDEQNDIRVWKLRLSHYFATPFYDTKIEPTLMSVMISKRIDDYNIND